MTLQKQPIDLYYICATNLWERFGFYTMRGILVLYMTKFLSFTSAESYAIFAAFTSLLYLAPLIGGYLADVFIGTKRSVLLGSFLLSSGYFLLAIPGEQIFYLGLSTLIIGSGFPNIANVLGSVYDLNDSRREGGFSILYSAINIGAFIPPLITATIIFYFGWRCAFIMAGMATLVSATIFFLTQYRKPTINIPWFKTVCLLFILLLTAVFLAFLVRNTLIANGILFILSGFFVAYTLIKTFQFSGIIKGRLLTCLLLTAFSILFCILCEQAAMSLTLFTEYNVNRYFYQWEIPTVSFLALNPFFIIVLGPIISKVWLTLEKRKIHFSIPAKFALGTLFVGIGFIILPLAIFLYSRNGQINFVWIVASYFIQSLGELLVYPVGLSMMTELAPKQMTGLMIGVWYLATAIANVLGGFASELTTLPSGNNNPLLTYSNYGTIFGMLGWLAIIAGFIAFMLTPLLKKMIEPQFIAENTALLGRLES